MTARKALALLLATAVAGLCLAQLFAYEDARAARVHIGQPYHRCHHAHCHRLSIPQAERMVVHRVGPGTVVKHCWWYSPAKDRCSYTTPAPNMFEADEGWIYESAITV